MTTLEKALLTLRTNKAALRARGVVHAAVFGSVARGDTTPSSDIDILVDLEPRKPCGVFEFVRLQIDMSDLIGAKVDLVERKALKPLVRESALRDAVNAF